MTDLGQVDFERYRRWLARMGVRPRGYCACTADGKTVWASGEAVATIEAALPDVLALDSRATTETTQAIVLPDLSMLLYHPLAHTHGAPASWFAVLLGLEDCQNHPSAVDEIAEALGDVAAAIRDESLARIELDTMAEELAERYEELHLVYAVDEQVRGPGGSRQIFENLLGIGARHLGVDVVALLRPAKDFVLSVTNLSAPIHNLDLVLVEMRGDLFRFVSSSRQTMVLNDTSDPRRAYVFTDMPYRVLAAPVFKGNEVAGMLVMLNHAAKREFRNSDRRLCEVIASHLSGMVRMVDMLDEMGTFSDQMAAALIESVEAKDPYTRGHSERVHRISMDLGRALHLTPSSMESLHWGSLLHDVGKIGIPDAVLCKPGRLTEDEYTFIKVHPERSYEILRHVARLKDAVPGARHHQEKWDGTGYPHGLAGEQIPLHGRIIAVADTYDSITSSRAYRAGQSHEFALREIRKVAGSQLDPTIVEVFVTLCASEPEWLRRFAIKRETLHE